MITRIFFMPVLFVNIFLNCVSIGSATNTQMTRNILQGVFAPLFTPFYKNCSRVNLDNFLKGDYLDAVDGYIVASAKGGEGYVLSEDECEQLYDKGVKVARSKNKIIIAQIGDPTALTMRLARYAETIGVDGILVLPPLYNKNLSPLELAMAIKRLADCAPNTPILLNLDPMALYGLNANIYLIYKYLSELIPTFAGVRGSLEQCLQIRSSDIYNPKRQYLIVSQHYSLQPASYMGFNASIAVATNLFPKLSVGIWYAKNKATATKYQMQINKNVASIATSPYQFLGAMKAAFGIITGVDQGNPRLPVSCVTCEQKKNITSRLENMGIKLKSPVRDCAN